MSDTVLGASSIKVIIICIHFVFNHLSFHELFLITFFSKNHWHEVVLSTYSFSLENL